MEPMFQDQGAEDPKALMLYSEEFSGSVNPGQFWRKMGYSPHGLMDPYYD
jgi:hypothetical protein